MELNKNSVTVRSPINIALIKYWGKLARNLNIPLNCSLSLTLDRKTIYSETKMEMIEGEKDEFFLYNKKGELIDTKMPKNYHILKNFFKNYYKEKSGCDTFSVRITSRNSFPTQAGMASSASGISCIALCFCRLFNFFEEDCTEVKQDIINNIKEWHLTDNKKKIERVFAISLLLRITSASSARSIFPFFVLQYGIDLNKKVLEQSKEEFDIEGFNKLINWEHDECQVSAAILLNKYFHKESTMFPYFDKISKRFPHIGYADMNKDDLSNFCLSFPITTTQLHTRDSFIKFFSQFQLLIVTLHKEKKKVTSTNGMMDTGLTSKGILFRVENVKKDLRGLFESVDKSDSEQFLELISRESNNFHSVCLDTYPPLFYMRERSFDVVNAICEFNKERGKTVVGYTFDAGPNPFIFINKDSFDDFMTVLLEKVKINADDIIKADFNV